MPHRNTLYGTICCYVTKLFHLLGSSTVVNYLSQPG